MTIPEAKGRLESFIDTFNICKEHDNSLVAVSISKEDIQAFTQAIKALEQEPCENCVSRQAVEEMIKAEMPERGMWEKEALYNTKNYLDGRGATVLDCLKIIDKHLKEVSE